MLIPTMTMKRSRGDVCCAAFFSGIRNPEKSGNLLQVQKTNDVFSVNSCALPLYRCPSSCRFPYPVQVLASCKGPSSPALPDDGLADSV